MESEHYESIEVGLSDLRNEVESLKSITIGEHTFTMNTSWAATGSS